MCTEDLGWVDTLAWQYELVTVYDKCIDVRRGVPLRAFASTNLIVKRIPNVGSAAGAYLTYILDRWDSLPALVQFGKGSSAPNGNGIPDGGIGQPTLDCPDKWNDCSWSWDHSDVAEYFNEQYWDDNGDCDFFNFHLTAYDFTNSPDVVGKMAWRMAGYANMGRWIDAASRSTLLNRDVYRDACCTGTWDGEFQASREQIRNEAYFPDGRLRDIYDYIHSRQHHPNAEIDHFMERTWRALFCARH